MPAQRFHVCRGSTRSQPPPRAVQCPGEGCACPSSDSHSSRVAAGGPGRCRVNPASPLATVGTSNARHVSGVGEATECGSARRLAVAVGDFHTAQTLPDSLHGKRKSIGEDLVGDDQDCGQAAATSGFWPEANVGGARDYARYLRESQPRSAPRISPASGANGSSVVTLTAMPSARPSTAPRAIAAPRLTCASVGPT
jgi:hypothetical protein